MEQIIIDISERETCDLYLLLNGALDPLQGFMNEKEYYSVLYDCKLPSGDVFTIPVVLIINNEQRIKITNYSEIFLRIEGRQIVAKLAVESIFSPSIRQECEKVYGTLDENHPGVRYLVDLGKRQERIWYVGGNVTPIDKIQWFDHEDLRKSPSEIKQLSSQFKAFIGFQTRNPLHRAHVEIILDGWRKVCESIPESQVGILLHPTVGPTQLGDVNVNVRIRCYRKVLEYLPKNTILAVIPLAMRMAGPREAIFHAIIRRNYGCTHFVMGRDPAAPSTKTKDGKNFYLPYAGHDLVNRFHNELGISVLCVKDMFYIPLRGFFPEDKVGIDDEKVSLSGTELRKRLKNNESVPEWFTFSSVLSELKTYYRNRGICIWFTGLSGSGKTTLAYALQDKLRSIIPHGKSICTVDGDELREMFPLGFSREDRSKNIKNAAFIASKITQTGGIAIVSLISPFKSDRMMAKETINIYDGDFIEVFINTPLEICEQRDPKGLYKKARRGDIKDFTGIDSDYEIPEAPNITIEVNEKKAQFDDLWNMVKVYLTK